MFKASRYDTIYPDRSKEVEFLLKYIKGKTVVDMGGGTGAISEALNKRGFDCTNIEPQKEMAKISERRGVKTIYSTIENIYISQGDKVENAIMMFDVFNFLTNPEEAFKNIAVSLKGRFIFNYWNSRIKKSGWEFNWKLKRLSHKRWSGNKVIIDFWFPFFHEHHIMRVYPDKYVAELLKKNGFKIVKKFKDKYTRTIVAKI